MTAVAGSVFTAAQFNQSVRDNLNETGPAKVSAAGQILVSTGANALAARTITGSTVATIETTTSTSYTDLTTPGPAVTVTTGTQALVVITALAQDSSTSTALMSFAISGATTVAASDSQALWVQAGAASADRQSVMELVTGLTGGSNTFTAKYRVSGSTGTWQHRHMIVIPL